MNMASDLFIFIPLRKSVLKALYNKTLNVDGYFRY